MNPRILTSAAVVVALSLVPALANAEQRSHGGSAGRSAGGSGARASAPRSSSSPRSYSAPRSSSTPRSYSAPRTDSAPRAYSGPRANASPGGYGSQRGYAGQRAVGVPRAGGAVRVAPRGFATRVIGPRVIIGTPFRSFYRPYYAFRPRFSLGLGFFVGYPVAFPYYGYAYPYPYSYPYGYAYPYSYPAYGYPSYPASTYPYPPSDPNYPASTSPYPPSDPNYPAQAPAQGSVGVAPGQQDFGGVSFEVTPSDAQIYVDGQYVGVVGNFTPRQQPLTLTPGRHHIEVRAAGYRTLTFETDVTPGQVIPYQGTMQR